MKRFFPILGLLGLLAAPASLWAHRLDEYLQATLVDIEPGLIRLHVNLTPGEAMADQVLNLFDRGHDEMISTNEATAYAELVQRDLTARVDGRDVPLRLGAVSVPEISDLRSGWGIIMVQYEVPLEALAAGVHTFALNNRHLPALSVYLFNAAQPRDASIRIGAQKRNETQSEGSITFESNSPPSSTASGGIALVALLFVVVASGAWKWAK